MTLSQWFRSLRCKHPEWKHVRTLSIFEHRYDWNVGPGAEIDCVTTTSHTVQKHYQCVRCESPVLRIDTLLPDNPPPLPARTPVDMAEDILRGRGAS